MVIKLGLNQSILDILSFIIYWFKFMKENNNKICTIALKIKLFID